MASKCDMCGVGEPVVKYTSEAWALLPEVVAHPGLEERGGWRICAECETDIEENNEAAVLERAVKTARDLHPTLRQVPATELAAEIGTSHQHFFLLKQLGEMFKWEYDKEAERVLDEAVAARAAGGSFKDLLTSLGEPKAGKGREGKFQYIDPHTTLAIGAVTSGVTKKYGVRVALEGNGAVMAACIESPEQATQIMRDLISCSKKAWPTFDFIGFMVAEMGKRAGGG